MFQNWDGPREIPTSDETFTTAFLPLVFNGSATLFALKFGEHTVGLLASIFGPDFHDGALVGTEAFWAVSPPHRNLLNSLAMYRAFEQECKDRGCKRIASGALAGDHFEAMKAFYQRRGYHFHSASFVKEIPEIPGKELH